MLRLVIACAVLAAGVAGAAPAPAAAQERRAVIAFLPAGGQDDPGPVLERLEAREQLAIGLMSATQGRYSREQAVLDLGQGTRTSAAAYDPEDPPELELVLGGDGSGFMFRFSQAVRRADTALADIVPGLLAGELPGGAGYAGVESRGHLEATVAADRGGDVATVSLGPAADLADRARGLLGRHRLVVVGLPTGLKGNTALDALLREREAGDLLIVMQTPPRARVPQLIPAGIAGLRGPAGELRSITTRLDGIVAGIDVLPTVLDHLGLETPALVKGRPISAVQGRDADALQARLDRLSVVPGRRVPTFQALIFSWLALTLVLGLLADRRGVRAALRLGALAVLWVLPVLLLTSALTPSRSAELAIVCAGALGLAALTDRLVPWPRGPAVPALTAAVTYSIDLGLGSPLIIGSLLGPNARSGSRFYGLGNELESALPVLLLVGLAALLHRCGRSGRAAATFAVAMAVLGVFVTAGRFGAAVGGVVTVGVGAAVATLLMLPGGVTRRRLLVVAAVPLAGLVALVAIDLATRGDGHFTRTVLDAQDGAALWDIVARRYVLAFNQLTNGAMPFLTALALLAAAYAFRYRERVYAPLRAAPSWRAALVGGFAAAVAGALSNDSGPVLLVYGTFVLACATAYVRGDPDLAREPRASPRA